ncbi:MAG: LD-carboxypeptidase [Lachnospiraceae bacterium]|nr:LD-carboxypeptidase [Lachnospiraceae bacterium]
MRYPEFLQPGGTIGFAAPSFGCSIEPYKSAFNHALEVFRKDGYQLQLGPNAYAGDGIGISSSPESCGKEFTEMYTSGKNDAIISCGGGELMCEILDYVNFDAIREAKPKWFMGYSDNTNLTFLLNTLCDTAAIYGPCAATFGMKPQHRAIKDAWKLLHGKKLSFRGYDKYEIESSKDEEHPLKPYNCTEDRSIVFFNPDGTGQQPFQFSGRLTGGCLDILVNLCGTKYDKAAAFAEKYKKDGIIWFLEACDLNVFSIRRAVWELQHAGWFEHVKGFLFGRPYSAMDPLLGLDHLHAVTDLHAPLHVPILLDVDLGHLPPMIPLISGSLATVSANPADGSMQISMKCK